MNSEPSNASQGSLPQLSGWLLWFYRIAWCALAIGALLATSAALLQPASISAVVALRLAKSAVLICVATILI